MQIELGAMSPKLSKQLAETKIPKDRLKVLDKLADSRTWLYLHGILTDAESEKAAHRLIAKVQKELNGANASHHLQPGDDSDQHNNAPTGC